jgi:hypothetical protein
MSKMVDGVAWRKVRSKKSLKGHFLGVMVAVEFLGDPGEMPRPHLGVRGGRRVTDRDQKTFKMASVLHNSSEDNLDVMNYDADIQA